MTLLIISHTDHYIGPEGEVVGWASTVQEINELACIFSKIIHIACLHKRNGPAGLEPYLYPNIEFIHIPPAGGPGLRKLTNILVMPIIIAKVFSQLRRSTCFQFRAPTAMGVYLIPLLTLFARKKGWYKYAGNWVEPNPPSSYALQRWMLKQWQGRKVTINGSWPDQPAHCLSFENPCLTEETLERGLSNLGSRTFTSPYNIAFVGRLGKNKGVDLLLGALAELKEKTLMGNIHIVGDGPDRQRLEEMARERGLQAHFHGFLRREFVFDILRKADILVLPSASEGFPKVLAEAWSFGCIPVVTRVSAIDQYVIEGTTGFLIERENRTVAGVHAKLEAIFERNDLRIIATNGYNLAVKFTYEAYGKRILRDILMYDQSPSKG